MAIDTAPKRKSVAGIGFFVFGPGVTPDATPDVFWRQCVAWGYGGISAGAPPEVPTGGAINPFLAAPARMGNRY